MRDWDLYFKTYYEEAIEALEEIGSILDYNTNARCKSGRRDLVDHVRHYKLNDGQYRQLYEQALNDLEEHKRRRQADNKFVEITDKIINELREKISRLEEENKQLQDAINHLKPASDAAEVIGLKIENNCLKSKINKLEKVLNGEM